MKVYTAPAGIACTDCGYAVRFDDRPDWRSGYAIGQCTSPHCVNHWRRFRFPLTTVDVEFVDEGGD